MSAAENQKVESARFELHKGRQSWRPKTRRVFRLLGLLLAALALWLGVYACRLGRVPNLTQPREQRRWLAQAAKDIRDTRTGVLELGPEVFDWLDGHLQALSSHLKNQFTGPGNGPREPQPSEAHEPAAIPVPQPPVPEAELRARETTAPLSKADLLRAEADAEYRLGQAAYNLTNPNAPQAQVQANLRAAAPHFRRCLDLAERIRALGGGDRELKRLEENASSRLYDCNKRQALSR